MYARFTDRARKVMQLANQEAQRLNHEYIGTEHMLLGLIAEGSGVGANVVKNLDVNLRKTRLEVEKLIASGPDMPDLGKLPQTPRAKKVIEYAMEESRALNHNYVGTEHILLGLLREQDGVAAQVLTNLGLKLQDMREEILNLLGHGWARAVPAGEAELLGKWYRDEYAELIGAALVEATKLKHDGMNAGHLLLAMLRVPDGVFVRTINSLGLTAEIVRNEILRQLKQQDK